MPFDRHSAAPGSGREDPVSTTRVVGKTTLTEQLTDSAAASSSPHRAVAAAGEQPFVSSPRIPIESVFGGHVQRQARGGSQTDDVPGAAARGLVEPATPLPFASAIQASFGPDHDVPSVQAHVGGLATTAAAEIGAAAYATGNHVAFARAPDLHLAAHEAAHVVQQRAGVQLKDNVGASGDPYEQHADAVADLVVKGQSAAPLLAQLPGSAASHGGAVQRQVETPGDGSQQTDPKAEAARVKKLIADYDAAVGAPKPDWAQVAKYLNGFNDADIQTRLQKLSPKQLQAMIAAAKTAMSTWHQRVTGPAQQILEEKRVAKLVADYDAAVASKNWPDAAKYLNGFNDEDILAKLKALDRQACVSMMEGAVTSMPSFHARVTNAIKSVFPGDAAAMDEVIKAAQKVATLEKKFQVEIVPREKWGASDPDKSKGWDPYPKGAPLPLTRIVVHHTAEPLDQTAKQLQDKEMKAGYADLPYHFVITANGVVHEGRQIDVVGAHAGEFKGNKDITKDPDYGSIGIVLTGDFESRMMNGWSPDKPTAPQLASLQRLLDHLTQKYKIDPKNIVKHSEVKRDRDPTVCPGENLSPIVDEDKKVAAQDAHLLEEAKAELAAARAKLK